MNNTKQHKNSYSFLREICSFNADFSAYNSPRKNPITNRVSYIKTQLELMGVEYEQDIFDAWNCKSQNEGKFNYVNINVFLKAKEQNANTICFLAHHDVNNKKSENAQDNSASVCNLLNLIQILKDKELKNNVLVSFTDAEEIADFKNSGAGRLAFRITKGDYGNVISAINLELTGLGKNLWVSAFSNNELLKQFLEFGALMKTTPYSDTLSLNKNGVLNTICIGILPDEDINKNGHSVYTWALCHKMEDNIEKCSEQDMEDFVNNVLMKFV